MDKEEVKSDFRFLEDDVLAVLLYGSQVSDESHERSDIDVCLVAPGKDSWKLLKKVFQNINVEEKEYDVSVFKDLKLIVQHSIIEDHEVVYCDDIPELSSYFYEYRKKWKYQAVNRLRT